MKKVVFYFGFPVNNWIPFSTFPHKMGTYMQVIETLTYLGCECFIAGTKKNYFGEKIFQNCLRYNSETKKWEREKNNVQADVIFDRTPWLEFSDSEFEKICINPLAFKKFGNDKFVMLSTLREFTKPFFRVTSQDELTSALKNFSENEPLVAKPIKGIKGGGIHIGTPHEIHAFLSTLSTPYLLQRFINTSTGIPNITPSHHDLRFIVVNNKILLAALRTPRAGSLLANVALGGAIEEIPLEKIPKNILDCAEKVKEKVHSLFGDTYCSLDFGIENGTPFLFEINDRIGFPRESMAHAPHFAKELAQLLAEKAY